MTTIADIRARRDQIASELKDPTRDGNTSLIDDEYVEDIGALLTFADKVYIDMVQSAAQRRGQAACFSGR